MKRYTLMLCVAAMTALSAGSVFGSDAMVLKSVLAQLRQELSEFDKDHIWPRTEPTFAADKEAELGAATVMKALGQRLDRNRSFDAYMKLQLLSFVDIASEGEGREAFVKHHAQVIRGMPTLIGRPMIASRDRTFLDSVNGEEQLSEGRKRKAFAIAEKYIEQDEAIEHMNIPISAYRERIVEALPSEQGLRLAGMVTDLDAAITARSSLSGRFSELKDECEKLQDPELLGWRQRQRLIALVEGLKRNRTVYYSMRKHAEKVTYYEKVTTDQFERYIDEAVKLLREVKAP